MGPFATCTANKKCKKSKMMTKKKTLALCAKVKRVTEGILQNVNIPLVLAVFLLIREVQKAQNDENPLVLCAKIRRDTEGILQNVDISLFFFLLSSAPGAASSGFQMSATGSVVFYLLKVSSAFPIVVLC